MRSCCEAWKHSVCPAYAFVDASNHRLESARGRSTSIRARVAGTDTTSANPLTSIPVMKRFSPPEPGTETVNSVANESELEESLPTPLMLIESAERSTPSPSSQECTGSSAREFGEWVVHLCQNVEVPLPPNSKEAICRGVRRTNVLDADQDSCQQVSNDQSG